MNIETREVHLGWSEKVSVKETLRYMKASAGSILKMCIEVELHTMF